MEGSKSMSEKIAHSKFGASGAKRWLACPGSVALSLKAPPQKESSYAKEGTEAHACLEIFLRNNRGDVLSDQLARMCRGKYPDEMIEHVKTAFYEIRARKLDAPKAEFLCETRVELGFIEEGMFGTVDAAIVEEFGRLTVIDFKYGAGILVDPADNPQLIYYALGLAHKFDYNFKDVALVIIQPRAEQDGRTTRQAIMSIEELMAWSAVFKGGVEACKKPEPEFSAGSHCRFCPATPICPEISKKALRQAQIDFAPIEEKLKLPEPEIIPVPYLSQTLKACDLIEKWIEGVRHHAFHVLETGQMIDGFKLVQKRAARKWINIAKAEREAEDFFGRIAFRTSLLSPAQLEKVATSRALQHWVDKNSHAESSGLTLVAASDKRDEVRPIEKDFDVVVETPLPKSLPAAKGKKSNK
jgi:hypothetical protein